MIGLVLAGGASSRMGTDKGLIQDITGNLWAKKAFQLLEQVNLTSYISINLKQKDSYLAYFNMAELLVDNSSLSIQGPLKGILSAHQQQPDEDLFVLASDMPNLTKKQISCLLDFQSDRSEYEIWIYQNQTRPEPLCAIYSARVLKQIVLNPPTKFGLLPLINQYKTAYLKISPDEIACFVNVNYPND